MTGWDNDDDVAAYIEATAAAVELEIAPTHMPGVIAFMKLAGEMAATLDEADLDPDEGSLAPTFRLPDAD